MVASASHSSTSFAAAGAKIVTPSTIRSDIATVFRHVEADSRASPVGILAHLEGSIHVARLVEAKSVVPKGIVFIGGLAESPVDMIQWQIVARTNEVLAALDADGDGVLTPAEVTPFMKGANPLKPAFAEDFSGAGPWTVLKLATQSADAYELQKRQALGTPDETP